MKRSSRLIILLGVLFAVLAFIGGVVVLSGGGGPQPTPPEDVTVDVIYAKADIAQGIVITAAMLEKRPVKRAEQPAESFSLPEDVIGRTARRSILKGAPLRLADVQGTAGVIDVARELKAGERAMAIQVDQVSGVGALIQPGDRVDIVVAIAEPQLPVGIYFGDVVAEEPITMDFPVGEKTEPADFGYQKIPDEIINGTSVKTLIQNVRVVKTLLPPPPTTPQGGEPQPPEEPALRGTEEIVIVAITAQQAEVIKFAQLEGSISLVLRSPEDRDAPADATTGIILRTLIDEYGVLPGRLVQTVIP